MDKIEKMFLDLNSVLVKFWKDQGRPEKGVKIALLERMLDWYKKMGYITLDTLSEEPDKSLEEAAEEFAEGEWDGVAVDTDGNPLYAQDEIEYTFKAGAEWQKNQMPMPEDTILFNKGVAEGRRLEREDSVECEVTDVGLNYLDLALFEAERLGLNKGDKVKVIVLKEDN